MTFVSFVAGLKPRSKTMIGVIFAIALGLSLVLALSSWAQDPADVQLDGQVLFQLEASPTQPAQERAETINQQLETIVEEDGAISVTVQTEGEQPTVWINQDQILRIYSTDLRENRTPVQQARVWANTLQAELQNSKKQRSDSYLRAAIILSILLVIVAGVLHWLMGRFWFTPSRWFLKQVGTITAQDQRITPSIRLFLNITLTLTRLGLWVAIALIITSLFPLTRSLSASIQEGLWTGLTEPFITLGQQSYSFRDVLVLLVMFLFLLLAIGAFVNFLKGQVLPSMGINRGSIEIISLITRYALITFGAIVLLQVWGLNLSSLTIVGSALGVGIGFGLQGIAKNFISGMVLLFERSVQVGDLIQVGDHIGIVERVSARSLIVKTLDRVSIIVPSSMILEDVVVNWSHDSLTCRLHIPVGVAYGTELNQVRTLLLQAAEDHSKVLNNPKPEVVFIGFGDSSLDFELLVWVNHPSRQLFIKSDLLFHIDALFRKHHIEIPFPQRDVHLRSDVPSPNP